MKLFALLCVAVLAVPFALLQGNNRPGSLPISETRGTHAIVSWVDGDSGRIDGRRFRLHGVDAPEGSPSRARCDLERVRADDARHAVRSLTMGKPVVVRRFHGFDTYGRELVDLSVGGKDVAATLMAEGHLKRWDYDAGADKPDWCR